jgi:hypothetical protein
VTGYLTNYPSVSVTSASFTVTVTSPCPATTLTWTSSPLAMTSAIATTQTVPTVVTDSVSLSQSLTGLCGDITYSINSNGASATTALTSIEL